MTAEQQFITGDCMLMAPADFRGFTCLIVDPPYSDHVHENAVSAGTNGVPSVERDLGFDAITPQLRGHISKIASEMSRWSVIFTDLESTHLWRLEVRRPHEYIREVPYIMPRKGPDAEIDYMGELPWIRWSQPQKSGDRPGSQAEAVLHFHAKGAKHWNGPGSLTHYEAKTLRGAEKHKCEKPLDLMLDLVSWWTDPGDSIVDVCAGTGTTALAAKLLGRDCMAIELNAKWAPVAARRLALDWSDRDAERVERWVTRTREEASGVLALPRASAADGRLVDERTRERAERRLADVDRVLAWL